MHATALSFLAEFGGLSFDVPGPRVTSAREPFELNPLFCLGEDDRFHEWGREIGRKVSPIGELDNGRFFLGLDEVGFIYLVADWLGRFGSGYEGVRHLALGYAPETVGE